MKRNKKDWVLYKREKGKIEIKGIGEQVNQQIWFDLITTKFIDMLVLTILLLSASKITLIAIAAKYLKDKIT